MKSTFSLFSIMFIGVCFLVSSAASLTINQGAQITAVGDGTAYIGTRQIDSATNNILSESWSPVKPSTNWEFKIYIVASGYGEVVLSLLGQSGDYDIGKWRNGPSLEPANHEVIDLVVDTLSPAYDFPMILFDSPPHSPLNEGYANEINTGSFTRTVSGSATARGRTITEYGGTTAGLNVGLNMTGPNAAVVIGSSENWRWSAGPSHPQQDVSKTATMSVSVSDSQSSSSGNTQSGSPSGTSGCSNDPNRDWCTDNGVCSHNGSPSSNGSCGHRWCLCTIGSQGTSSSSSSSGCANNPSRNWCTDTGSCSTRSPSGVPGECGHNYCCCAPYGSPMYNGNSNNGNSGNTNTGQSNNGNSGNSNNGNSGTSGSSSGSSGDSSSGSSDTSGSSSSGSDSSGSGNTNSGSDDSTPSPPTPSPPTPSPPTPSPPAMHPCGVHSSDTTGDHSVVSFSCGLHTYNACSPPSRYERNRHVYYGGCTHRNSNGQRCTVFGYYGCQSHTHTYD